MSYQLILTSLSLLITSSLATTSNPPCYLSTTTIPHPALSCTPFDGICPLVLCPETARPQATVTVPQNYADLITACAAPPTVTSYGGVCTTDCGPVTCPTLTVTESTGEERACCGVGGY